MDDFKCTYVPHERESVMGFCLNQNCKNTAQFCFKCLNDDFHPNHMKDCIRFASMREYILDSLQVYTELSQQIINIIGKMNNFLEQFKKRIDQEIQKLNNLNQQLLRNDYSSLKSQIQHIKQIYSKEKEKELQLQLQKLNKVIDTIETVTQIQNQVNAQINKERKIKITQINENDNQSQIIKNFFSSKNEELDKNKNFQDPQNKLDNPISQSIDFYLWKSYGLNNLGRFQEAIECCQQAIKINPQNDMVWNNLGFALNSLGRYQEAIQNLDQAILIDPKNDMAENNKGFSLTSLQQYEKATQRFNRAIKICPNNHLAHMNNGFALHQLNQFQEAIVYYDNALTICDDPHIKELKLNSMAKLRRRSLSNIQKADSFQR